MVKRKRNTPAPSHQEAASYPLRVKNLEQWAANVADRLPIELRTQMNIVRHLLNLEAMRQRRDALIAAEEIASLMVDYWSLPWWKRWLKQDPTFEIFMIVTTYLMGEVRDA